METAYMRARIRTIIHVEKYFDFMASRYARGASFANAVLIDVWYDSPAEPRGNDNRITGFRPNENKRAIQSKPRLKHVFECLKATALEERSRREYVRLEPKRIDGKARER